MRYNWDLKELEANRIILEKIYKNIDNDTLKEKLSNVINMYVNMIRIAKKNIKGMQEFDRNYKDISVDIIINDLLTTYNKNTIMYWDVILNSYFPIRNYEFNGNNVFRKIKTNNQELVDIAIDFFNEMTTPTIANKFQNILNDGNRIQINYEKGSSNYGGLTLFENLLKNKYIYIRRENELLDLVLLPHEAFHYMFMGENNDIVGNYNTMYLNEVEGMFANILFTDYADKITENGSKYFKDYFNNTYKLFVYDAVIRYAIIQSITNKRKIKFNKLNQFLETICPNPEHFEKEEQFIKYLDTPQDFTMTYTLSYLTAIDLYYKYLNDRDEAFYFLECIRNYKKTNQVFNLLNNNGITFMNDNYENLKRYIKK